MPRIRSIRPDFVELEYLAPLSIQARYLYLVMKPFCDDMGRIRAATLKLSRTLFPYDDDSTVSRLNAWVAELIQHRVAICYEVAGNRFLQIVHFTEEEYIDKPGRRFLPAPDDPGAVLVAHTRLLEEMPLANPREPSRILANPRETSRGFANPRASSDTGETSSSELDQPVTENPTEDSRMSPRLPEDSRGFANPRLGREGNGFKNSEIGGGGGEPFGFDLEPPSPPSGQSGRQKTQTKLPKPYPMQAEHERIGLEVMPTDADIGKLFAEFVAYWHSNGKMKADWVATWRVWCGNAIQRGYPRKPVDPSDAPAKRRSILDWADTGAGGVSSQGRPAREGGA